MHHARIKYWLPDDQSSPVQVSWLDVYVDNAIAPALRVQLDPACLASTFSAASVFAGFTASNSTTLLADVTVSNFKLRVPQLAPSLSNLVALPAAQLPGVEGSVVLQARSACNVKMLIGGDAAAIQATLTSPPVLDAGDRHGPTGWHIPAVLHAARGRQLVLERPDQRTNGGSRRRESFRVPRDARAADGVGDGRNVPYTGSPRLATGTATGVFNEDLGPLTFTYNGQPAAIDGGTYAVVGSFAGSLRYAAATADATLIITPVQPTVSVTGGTITYNGLPRHATGTATGVQGEDLGPLSFSYSPGGSRQPTPAHIKRPARTPATATTRLTAPPRP